MFKPEQHKRVFDSILDDPKVFPKAAFDLFKKLDLLTICIPKNYNGKAWGINGNNQKLLHMLRLVGRADLSVGRIFEGHLNGLLLIERYGNQKQKERYYNDAKEGKLFSVWNTESSPDGVTLSSNLKLKGSKIFCSGGLNIQRPLITAKSNNGWQMIVLDSENLLHLKEDWSLWKPLGMQASVSSRIDFTGIQLQKNQLLGSLDNYSQEPMFSGGAIRFAAVQLGGAEAVANIALEHLQKNKRTENPYQKKRLGEISILLASGKQWLKSAGEIADQEQNLPQATVINHANMVRTAILDICNNVVHLAEKSIGLQGFMQNHPMEKLHRDMSTYLKQPGPDLALANIGTYASSLKAFTSDENPV